MKKLIFIIIFVFSSNVFAETYGNVSVDKIVSVYDGDTFRCNIKDWPKIAGKNIAVRVKGIDTPEIRCKKTYSDEECKKMKTLAISARRLTENLLKRAKTIELRNIERGKYFRILADVYVDDKNLAEILIKNKLAVNYDGGTKKDWLDLYLIGYTNIVSPELTQSKKIIKPRRIKKNQVKRIPVINRDAVKKVINDHMVEVKLCEEYTLSKKPHFQGKIVFQWGILETGDVDGISVQSSTISNDDLIACIKSKIAQWKFPTSGNGKTIISYPFVFEG